MSINQGFIKWSILTALWVFFPAYIFVILADLISPIAYVAANLIIPGVMAFNFGGLILFLPNILIWGIIFYFISKKLSKKIYEIQGVNRSLAFGAILLTFVCLGMAPIYEDGVRGSKMSAYKAYASLNRFFYTLEYIE